MKLRTLSLVLGALYALCAVVPAMGGPQQMLLMSYRAQVVSAPPAFVQANSSHTSAGVTSQTVVFSGAQSAGDLNVIAIGFCNSTSTISSVADTEGNTYAVAAPATSASTNLTQVIYYAPSIAAAGAGANTVTVTFNVSTPCSDVRIAEYSGIFLASPVDTTASGSATTGTAMSSGSASTSNVVDLLVGASYSAGGFASAGSGYTNRVTSSGPNNLQDEIVNSAGPYSATATNGSSGYWVMQMAAFKGSSGAPPAPPTTLAGLAVSGNHFINSATGATVQLAGAAISGMEGQQGSWTALAQVTTSQWGAIAAKYGINMLRFPMNSAYWINNTVYDDPAEPGGGSCCYTSSGTNQYTPDPSGTYQSAIQTIVANVTAAGIVADLDLHWDGPKNTSTNNPIAPIGQPGLASGDYAPVFWTQVANTFLSNPLVVFELFNEPFGGANYNSSCPNCALIGNNSSAVPSGYAISMIAGGSFSPYQMQMQKNNASNALFNLTGCGTACNGAGMEPLITAIRATGATNVILAAPIWYAGGIQTWLASYTTTTYGGLTTGNPDPLGQLGVSWHQYRWNGGTAPVYNVLSNGYPIVITETQGFNAANDGGTFSNNAYPWAFSHNIGVEIWAWATWADGGCSTGTCFYNYMNSTPPWSLNSVPAPAGNTFGQSVLTGGSNAPGPAAAVGYTTQTFNSITVGTSIGQLQSYTFFGNTEPGGCIGTSGANLLLGATANCNYGVSTAHSTGGSNWAGIAFGGGAYFEATYSLGATPTGSGVAWWANDIEHETAGNPAYTSWVEPDFFEYDTAHNNENGISDWNWYNCQSGGPHCSSSSNINVETPAISGASPITYPGGVLNTGTHRWGWLWVPATASTQGYSKRFIDGVQIGPTSYWNLYNATTELWSGSGAQPANFPPTASGVTFNVIDTLHLAPILGGSNSVKMTVSSVVVWQASSANNLVH